MRILAWVWRSTLKVLNSSRKFYRQPDFICVDCERWEQCALRSSDDCLIKVEGIARNARSRWIEDLLSQRWSISPWASGL